MAAELLGGPIGLRGWSEEGACCDVVYATDRVSPRAEASGVRLGKTRSSKRCFGVAGSKRHAVGVRRDESYIFPKDLVRLDMKNIDMLCSSFTINLNLPPHQCCHEHCPSPFGSVYSHPMTQE